MPLSTRYATADLPVGESQYLLPSHVVMKLIDSPPVSTSRSARACARSFDSLTSLIQRITTTSTTIQNTRPTP